MDELIGLRGHNGATLRLAIATGLPKHMQGKVREVVSFQSEHEGQGHASELLKQVCEEADTSAMTLMVSVEPFGDEKLDTEQLKVWYAKHGFIEIQVTPCLMARMPHSTPLN